MDRQSQKHYDELKRKQTLIKDRVRSVFYRKSCGMYLHGRPGTGKNHTVFSTLDKLGASYRHHQGHLTPIGLFDLLAEYPDQILVLDDVSSIFNQPIALQILLSATGERHDDSGKRIVKHKTANGERVVSYTGGIICMSNLQLDGHHHKTLAALRDRIDVFCYEPSDDEIEAVIKHIADTGYRGVVPEKARMVAMYLIQQCQSRKIRPSVRMYVDKALKCYRLWEDGQCETHWQDLVASSLEQQMIELKHGTRDLSRAEQMESDRRIALEIFLQEETVELRVAAWEKRTGKKQAAFYRRLKELKVEGVLEEVDSIRE